MPDKPLTKNADKGTPHVKHRQIVATVIGLLLLSIFSIFTVSAQDGLTTTVKRAANIRLAPDSGAELLGTVGVGTTIRLDGRNDNGNWVRGITAGGTIGWLSSGTVDITLGDMHNLSIITADTPFLLSAPAQAAAPQPSASGGATSGGGYDPNGVTVMATGNVNVRSGPNTDYRRVGGVFNGTPFTIDGRDTTAYWVRGISQEGIVGWVYVTYLAISNDEVLSLAAVSVDAPFTLSAPGGGAVPDAETEAAPAVTAPPVVSTAPVSGFSYGAHVDSFNDHAANLMHYAGMTWVKRQFRYYDGQAPASAAGWINDAHARGFRILLGVVGIKDDLNNPGYYERYTGFLAGLAQLGADAIEVWNEPNIEHEWPAGSINPAQYTELLRQSYSAIKNANPNVLVISAALAPTGYFGGCSGAGCDDNHFITGMAQAGAANYMDCIGIHYNEGILPPTATSGDPRGNSGHYTRYFRSMMDVYYNAFGGARPLCFTELGYLTPEGYGPLSANFGWAGNTSVAQQAAWIDQVVSLAASSGRVRMLIIWNMDFASYGTDPMAGYALIRPGGGCPACDALAH
jgi:uncharacterized protein YraI